MCYVNVFQHHNHAINNINRLLDPLNTSITLSTIENAVVAMGKRLQIQLL